MGRIYKTPALLRTCTAPMCDLGADFTIKDHKFTPIGYLCAKHAFLLKAGGKVAEWNAQQAAKEFVVEDGDEVDAPGADDDGSGNPDVH